MTSSDVRRAPLVLVCAPSGTDLTRVGSLLRKEINEFGETALVFDLESELCVDRRKRAGSPTDQLEPMAKVVRDPRSTVLQQWDSTCERIIAQLAHPPAAISFGVLFLHLTWYDPSTSEFFSPVNAVTLSKAGEVRHVVLLIDDIYDMFSKLQGRDNEDQYALYTDAHLKQDAKLLMKLWKVPQKPTEGADGDLVRDYEAELEVYGARRELEAKELALTQLLSWRRAEMIQAENLARTLRAEFTLLATKHSRRVLRLLVGRSAVRKTYLSHRISEVRRMNKDSNQLPHNLGEWSEVVDEVNRLHLAFANRDQVLLNPTAIDELRFDDAASGGPGPLLARRWPLPGGDLLWTPPRLGNSPEHTQLLTGDLPSDDPISMNLAQTLSKQIFFDIAARDHMIVEHTPGLCVYRPFFGASLKKGASGADWSSGVRSELEHWERKAQPSGPSHRRAAFVHTDSEVTARLQWLKSDQDRMREVFGTARRHLERCLIDSNVSPRQRRLFFGRRTMGEPVQLDRRPDRALLDLAPHIVNWMTSCTAISLFDAFTRLSRPPRDNGECASGFEVGLFYTTEDEYQRVEDLDTLAESLCDFFELSDGSEWSNQAFWTAHDRVFRTVFGSDPANLIADELGIAYQEFVEENKRQRGRP